MPIGLYMLAIIGNDDEMRHWVGLSVMASNLTSRLNHLDGHAPDKRYITFPKK